MSRLPFISVTDESLQVGRAQTVRHSRASRPGDARIVTGRAGPCDDRCVAGADDPSVSAGVTIRSSPDLGAVVCDRHRRGRRAEGARKLRALHAAAGRLNWSIAAAGGFHTAVRLSDGSSALASSPPRGALACADAKAGGAVGYATRGGGLT